MNRWLARALIAYSAVITLAFGVYWFHQNMIADKGNMSIIVGNPTQQMMIIDELYQTGGMWPSYQIADKDAVRAAYTGQFMLMVDAPTDAALLAELGNPKVIATVVVDKPNEVAEARAQWFRKQTTGPVVVKHLSDKLSIIAPAALPGIVFGFRLHKMDMGPKPPRWPTPKGK